jgi:hypothetical protein
MSTLTPYVSPTPLHPPMNPLISGILSQLGANPQALIEQLMPMILPCITPSIDALIKDRVQHLMPYNENTSYVEKSQDTRSGADALICFTDMLIPSGLQTKIMEDPGKLAKLQESHKLEIAGIANRLEHLWVIT